MPGTVSQESRRVIYWSSYAVAKLEFLVVVGFRSLESRQARINASVSMSSRFLL
jgi:hypothetical protein